MTVPAPSHSPCVWQPQREAELYNQWITNDRQARALLAQMREVAAKATGLILQEDTNE